MKSLIWVALSVLLAVSGMADPGLPAAWIQPAETCRLEYQTVSRPLTELGSDPYVRLDGQATEFTGGLYPDGSNTPPPAHLQAGLTLASEITPLDNAGSPDEARGRIGMVSLGMSNASSEFGAFIQRARSLPGYNPHLVLVNGAQPNQTAERWTDPAAPTWTELERRLERQRLAPAQVQIVWIKQTHPRGGAFPEAAQLLEKDLEAIVHNLHAKFPNLKLVFLSSRTRSYNLWRGLSPEPSAFETGFAVKWLIERQINGDPVLNYDPGRGDVTAPFLVWGPYLWIDGETPRADGQVWLPSDMRPDCTHPSPAGTEKVADMLQEFFTTDPLARDWFLLYDDNAVELTVAQPATVAPATLPGNSPASPVPPSATLPPSPIPRPTETPLPKNYRATVLAEMRPTRPGGTPAAVAGTPADGMPAPAGADVRSLPTRRLAPLGLAFVILLCLGAAGGVWYWIRRRPRR